ncbi:MAG: hypothetical protein NTX54_05435, partial [Chloroflexi bacterium]|nr:hypothetical protein [Chloroflexota bacterium]
MTGESETSGERLAADLAGNLFVQLEPGDLGAGSIGFARKGTLTYADGALVPGRGPVVLKQVHSYRATDPNVSERFTKEYELLTALIGKRARVPRPVFLSKAVPTYFVMELAQGDTLMKRAIHSPLKERVAVALGVATMRTISIAHGLGISYRDWSLQDLFWDNARCDIDRLHLSNPDLDIVASADGLTAIDWNASAEFNRGVSSGSTGANLSKNDGLTGPPAQVDITVFGREWFFLVTGTSVPLELGSLAKFCIHPALAECSLWLRWVLGRCLGLGDTPFTTTKDVLAELEAGFKAWKVPLVELYSEATSLAGRDGSAFSAQLIRAHSIGRARAETEPGGGTFAFAEDAIASNGIDEWKVRVNRAVKKATDRDRVDWVDAEADVDDGFQFVKDILSLQREIDTHDLNYIRAVHAGWQLLCHEAVSVELPGKSVLARAMASRLPLDGGKMPFDDEIPEVECGNSKTLRALRQALECRRAWDDAKKAQALQLWSQASSMLSEAERFRSEFEQSLSDDHGGDVGSVAVHIFGHGAQEQLRRELQDVDRAIEFQSDFSKFKDLCAASPDGGQLEVMGRELDELQSKLFAQDGLGRSDPLVVLSERRKFHERKYGEDTIRQVNERQALREGRASEASQRGKVVVEVVVGTGDFPVNLDGGWIDDVREYVG